MSTSLATGGGHGAALEEVCNAGCLLGVTVFDKWGRLHQGGDDYSGLLGLAFVVLRGSHYTAYPIWNHITYISFYNSEAHCSSLSINVSKH